MLDQKSQHPPQMSHADANKILGLSDSDIDMPNAELTGREHDD
ncbi:MAG: hypothetical protein ABL933_06415 [Methyloglobulus sp.]